MHSEEQAKIAARRDAFASIAFWQIMAFVFLLCIVWASELLDFPQLVYGAEHTPFSWFRVSFLSAAVIASAVITVGHTYEQQRDLLKKLLKTCLYCHRVKTPHGTWEHVEEYFIKHYPVAIDRGACPSCQEMLADLDKERDKYAKKQMIVVHLDR